MRRLKSRILVVDDDQIICRALCVILRKSGYDVSVVQNGAEAQKQLKEKIFNIVILDKKLPDISGLELLRFIRKKYPEIMIIMVTAYATVESSIEAMSGGAFSYIVKPYDMSKIKEIILQALKEQKILLKNKKLIDDLKGRNKKLIKTQEKLLQSAKLVAADQVVSEVSHKIKSSLTVIDSAAYLIENTLPFMDDGILEKVEMIKRGTKKIGKCIENLLDSMRPIKINPKLNSINEIIEKTIQERQDLFKDIIIKKELSPDLPELFLDADRFQEVFVNIFSNASEAMSEKGKLRIISTESKDRKDVEVFIEDTGCGIPRDNVPKLFDPFFTTKPKGMGLGLPIVRKIIDSHRGVIEVRSKMGKGTSFIIRLPVAN